MLESLKVSVAVALLVVVLVGASAVYLFTARNLSSGGPLNTADHNSISLEGVGLCSNNCVYPAPYLSGLVIVDGSVPLAGLILYVNGTYVSTLYPSIDTRGPCYAPSNHTCTLELGGSELVEGDRTISSTFSYGTCVVPRNGTICYVTVTGAMNTLTQFDQVLKSGVPNSIHVVAGKSYKIGLLATFADGSTTSTSVTVVAS